MLRGSRLDGGESEMGTGKRRIFLFFKFNRGDASSHDLVGNGGLGGGQKLNLADLLFPRAFFNAQENANNEVKKLSSSGSSHPAVAAAAAPPSISEPTASVYRSIFSLKIYMLLSVLVLLVIASSRGIRFALLRAISRCFGIKGKVVESGKYCKVEKDGEKDTEIYGIDKELNECGERIDFEKKKLRLQKESRNLSYDSFSSKLS